MPISLTESDVRNTISTADAINAVRRAHIGLANGTIINEPRSRVRSTKMMLATMSAIDLERGFAGSKVYTATGPMISCHVLLYEVPSGKHLATVEGIELGRLRTAAASLMAASIFVPKYSRAAIIGSGFQAEGVLRGLAETAQSLGLQEVFVASRAAEHAQQLAGAFAKSASWKVTAASVEEACRGAEVLFTCTSAAEPVLKSEWIQNIKHISALGSNSPARRELPARVLAEAQRVVVDDQATARIEGGNLIPVIENGKLPWAKIEELGTVLKTGGNNAVTRGYSIFCSHGLAAQDLVIAELAAERYQAASRLCCH